MSKRSAIDEQGDCCDFVLSEACERDVDLMLVEEFACSHEFQSWFWREACSQSKGLEHLGEFCEVQVRHDVLHEHDQIGQTDFQVLYSHEPKEVGCRTAFLIEDKIDAPFQPDQPERYQKEARRWMEKNPGFLCLTVIVSPKEYMTWDQDQCPFNVMITYEEVRAHLEDRRRNLTGEAANRLAHKSSILQQAIQKKCAGPRRLLDQGVTEFWTEYLRLASEIAPELRMSKRREQGVNSNIIYFGALGKHPRLPPVKLRHKTKHGLVELQFERSAKDAHLEGVLTPLLEEEMLVQEVGKSLGVQLRVPRMSVHAPLQQQQEAAREALSEARRLRDWYDRIQARLAASMPLS